VTIPGLEPGLQLWDNYTVAREENLDRSGYCVVENIVAYLLKAKIVEPEEKFTARKQHANNTWLGVLYAVRATFPQQQRCTQQ
jgi:hypothetical protein